MISRPIRQVLATVTVVFFTIAPTVYISFTAWRIHQPWQVHEVEIELGGRLGMQASMKGVRYPKPGVALYSGLVLRQEERRSELTEPARAELAKLSRSGQDLLIETDGLQLHASSPRQAMDQVAALLRKAGKGDTFEHINLLAPTCEIELGDGPPAIRYQVRDLVGSFRASEGTPTLTVSYRFVNRKNESSTRCELSLVRDRGRKAGGSTLTFRTTEGPPLPGSVLDPFFAADDRIGSQAGVEGTLILTQEGDAAEWGATFQGSLTNVDLSHLVDGRDPAYRLTGPARVLINGARWANRPGQGFGWAEVSGEIEAGPGTIGTGLLRSLASEMRFRLNPKIDRVVGKRLEVRYRSFGVGFALASDGQLDLKGALGTEFPAESVLVHGDNITPLVYAPKRSANTRGLVKALFPAPNDVLVPGTAEAQAIQRYLPLPIDIAERARTINSN